ncbi:hypothetical protein BGX30_007555, partial [Mortierella sp. GBA39]
MAGIVQPPDQRPAVQHRRAQSRPAVERLHLTKNRQHLLVPLRQPPDPFVRDGRIESGDILRGAAHERSVCFLDQ